MFILGLLGDGNAMPTSIIVFVTITWDDFSVRMMENSKTDVGEDRE